MDRILRVGTLDSAIGSKRLLAVTLWFAVIVCLLTVSSVSAAAQVAASVSSNPGVTVSPAAGTTPVGLWNNPKVTCSPIVVTTLAKISARILPPGSSYQAIPNKRALHPPCSAGSPSNATYVEVHGVHESGSWTTTTTDFCPPVTGKIALTCEDTATSYDAVNGGATYPCGCPNDDQTGDVSDATGSIHIEIDHDWNATPGWAPPRLAVSSSSVTFDVQGFAYFDCGTNPATSCSQNPSGHWEIHPVTGWKLSTEDFSVSSSPSNLSLFAGTSGSSTVITSGLNGFTGSVTLSTTVSPSAGVSVSLNPSTVNVAGGTANSTLCVGTTKNPPSGSYAVTVKGTSGSISHSTTLTVTVTTCSGCTRDFNVTITPSFVALDLGSSKSSTAVVKSIFGFTGSITLSASVSQTGLACSLSPTSVSLGVSANSTLTCNGSNSGGYIVTVVARNATGWQHSATANFRVQDFTINDPSTLSLIAGQQGTSIVSLGSLYGFVGTVSVSASVSPGASGLSVSITPSSVSLAANGTGTTTLTVQTSASTPRFLYTVLLNGTSRAINHRVSLALNVTADFTVSASVTSLSFTAGSSGSFTTNLSSLGLNGTVAQSVAVSTATSTVTVSFNPARNVTLVPGGTGSSTVTVLTTSSTPAGSYSLILTGTTYLPSPCEAGIGTCYDPLAHSITVTISVSSFSVTINPRIVTVSPGSKGTSTMTVTSLNGFTGSVSLTSSTSSNLSCTLNPTSVSLSTTASSTLSCNGSPGTYTVSFTGNVSATLHSASVLIHVGDFAIIVTSPVNFNSGATGAFISVLLSSTNNFAGGINVTSTVSPPSGLSVTCPSALVSLTMNGTASARCNLSSGARGTFVVTISGSGSPGTALHSASSTVNVGDFTITITGPVSFNSGSSSSVSISLASISNFAGSVTLIPFNPPAAVTITCPSSPVSLNNTTANASCNMSSSSSGSYTVTITGSGSPGTTSHQASVTVRVGDFVIVASGRVNFNSGSSGAIISLSLNSTFSFSGSVSLVSSTTPSTGLTVSCQTSVSLSTNGTAIGSCDLNSTSPGVYIVIVTGSGSPGTATHRISSIIHVGGFDFAVRPRTNFNSGASGAVVTVSLNSTFDFVGSVTITSSPITGLTVNCPASSISVSDNSTNTVSCGLNSTIIGRYAVNITGTASPGTASHSGSAVVHVGGFTITPLGATSFNLGAPGISVTLTVTSNFDFSGSITFSSATSAPSILTINCNAPTITLNGNSSANTSCGLSSSTQGTYIASITGRGSPGTSSHASVVTVHVGDFTISVLTVDINSGQTGQSVSITVTGTYNFTGTVGLAGSASPAGGLAVNCSGPGINLSGNNTASSQCSLASTKSGTYVAFVTGAGSPGSTSHTASGTVHVGDFTINFVGKNINVGQTGISLNVTLSSTFNFAGGVTLTASSTPSGLTINCPTTAVALAPNGTSTTLCSLNSSTSNMYPTTISANGSPGTAFHAAGATVHVGDFTISVQSSTNINSGVTAAFTQATLTSKNNFAGTVSLAPTVTPSNGLSVSCSGGVLAENGTVVASCALGSSTPGTYALTIASSGSPGSAAHSAFMTVHVGAPQITAPTSSSFSVGSSSLPLTVTSVNNFSGTVALSSAVKPVSGLTVTCPGQVSLSPNASTIASCGLSSTSIGTYGVTTTGAGSPGTATSAATISVSVGNFTISAINANLNVGQTDQSVNVTITSINFNGTITLQSSAQPSGLSVQCPTTALTVNANLTINVLCFVSSTSPGTYVVTITGVASLGGTSHSATASVSVGDFSISLPPRVNFNIGQTNVPVNIVLTSMFNFSGNVTINTSPASGLTITCPTNQALLPPNSAVTLTCSLNSSSPRTYPLTITGVALTGSATHSAISTVHVGDFAFSSTTRVSLAPGSTSAVITVTVSSLNNFVGDVTISTSTSPSTGLTVNCPAKVSVLENLTIQFSCGLSSGTPGSYNVTLRGVGSPGTSSHLSSTIVQVGDYIISTPKPSISFNSGASGSVIPVSLKSMSFDDSVKVSSTFISSNGVSITCPSSPVGLTSNNTVTTSCSLSSSTPGTYLATITGVSSLGSIAHSFNVTLHVGDFSISATSPAAAQAGSSPTSTITLASSSFNGSISVRISPPTGLSCNPTNTGGQLAANATNSIPLSCTSSKAGTFNVPMTATGSPGTSSHAASATFTFVDFNMTSTPSTVPPLLPNAVGNSTITIRSLNGFTGTVDLVASISPASGLVCTLTPTSVGVTPLPPGNSNSTLSCNGSAGLYTVTVTGTSGSLSHTTTVSYSVQDFTISASPTSLRVNAGTPGNSTIAVTSLSGYSGTVFLTYAIAPGSGLTCNLTPENVILGTSSSSTLSCKGSAATYNVNVTGTSGSLSHSVLVTYTVQDFTVSANPTSATADAGARGNSTITVASLNGFTGTVGLTTTVSPANGLNCAFSQNTVSLGTSGTSRLSCSGSAGPYTVTVTGRSGSLSHSVTVSYTIQDFTVAAVSASLTIDAGVTGNSTITVRSLDGFPGPVTLALAISSNSGLNCNLSQPSVALGAAGNSTLACNGSAAYYTVTVTGTGRSLSRSTTVQFTVQDYTVTAGTTALIVNTGVNGNSTITVASLDGFSGA